MRQSAQLVLLMSLTFFTGAAHAVDRGQFENVPDDIRAWFKGVRSQDGVPCCDISDGHRTEYDVRAGAYWVSNQWFVVAGAGKGDHSKTPETRLAKPSFGMSVFAAISRSAASSRPMLVRRVVSATDGIDGSEIFLRASESYHSLVCEVLCVQFTFGIGAYWKGRSPISADKIRAAVDRWE